jgi:hypothetical protein
MEQSDNLVGTFARLPDGELVRIEEIVCGFATVRRVEGDRKGTIAVCAIVLLKPADN